WDDIDDAGRDADLRHEFADAQGAERRQLGRLQNYRVARGKRRAHFPAREHEREVPGHDLADNTDWYALDIVEEPRLDRHDTALIFVGHAAEIAEGRRRAWHVEAARVADRVSGVETFQMGQAV